MISKVFLFYIRLMNRNKVLLLVAFFTIFMVYSQESNEKNYTTFGDFLNEQTSKLDSVKNEMNLEEVKEIMGSSLTVKVPKVGKMKPLTQLFNQPEFSKEFIQNPKKTVLVLWYFTTPKDQNGVISKNECTPILLENGIVKGKGWKFYTNYRRINRLMR